MAYRMLSDKNGYLPEASGLVVAHVRREKDFPLNKYVQYVPSPKSWGLYSTIGRDNSARMKTQAGVKPGGGHGWADGADMPSGRGNKSAFTTTSFLTQRHAIPWEIGYQALEQTDLFKPKLLHMNESVSQMMTLRSLRTVTTLTSTTANDPWPSLHIKSANDLNGGKGPWPGGTSDPSDPSGLAIYRTLMAAFQKIHLATNGVVRQSDLRTIIGPGMAMDIAQSAELQNFVKENTGSIIIMKEGFEKPGAENNWGMPVANGKPVYRSFEFVIEDSVYVNEYVKEDSTDAGIIEATTNRLYMWPDDKGVMMTRQGALDGTYGQKSYSTYVIHHHGGLMRVKAKDDPWHEKIYGAVVEEIFETVAAPYSGLLMTGLR